MPTIRNPAARSAAAAAAGQPTPPTPRLYPSRRCRARSAPGWASAATAGARRSPGPRPGGRPVRPPRPPPRRRQRSRAIPVGAPGRAKNQSAESQRGVEDSTVDGVGGGSLFRGDVGQSRHRRSRRSGHDGPDTSLAPAWSMRGLHGFSDAPAQFSNTGKFSRSNGGQPALPVLPPLPAITTVSPRRASRRRTR